MVTRQALEQRRQKAGIRLAHIEVSAHSQWVLMKAGKLPDDYLKRNAGEQKQLLKVALQKVVPVAIERLVDA
jgi:hypothetical protein